MLENINGLSIIVASLISVLIFGKIIIKDSPNILTKKNIILFLTICILQTVVFLYIEGAIKTLIMFLSNIIFYKYIFKISFSKSIFITFIYMILLAIPDAIVLLFTTKVLGISKELCYNFFAGSIMGTIIVSSIFIIISLFIKNILRRIVNIKIEDNVKIIIYFILTFICIIVFFYRAFSNIKIDLNFIISISTIIVFLVILASLIKQTIDNQKLSKEYDNLLEFMTTYENEIEKQRILRHETKNEFLTIRAKICDNQENKEIINYIDEILKDKITVKQEEYAKFGYLPANGIKGLCYFKVQVAEENNIKVSLNISKKIKDSTIYKLNTKQQRDFGRILGVILDNAIESSSNSKEKQLGIETYVNSNKECKMITQDELEVFINELLEEQEKEHEQKTVYLGIRDGGASR